MIGKAVDFILKNGLKAAYKIFPPKEVKAAAEKIATKQTKNIKKKVGKGVKIGAGTAAGVEVGGGLGFGKSPIIDPALEFAKNKLKMNKGGIVAPKMGGKPSFKTKKSSKSIAKKYFKGTFQLVELTKALKHIINKIDSEIENRKNAFADGKIIKDNFEKSVGQVRGLVLAKEIVRETAKNIEELDD